MIKILGWVIVAFIVIFAFFGLLICIEYLRYFKRKISLKLNDKLCRGVSADD